MGPQTTRASLLSRVRDPAAVQAWREFEARYGELIFHYAKARGLNWHDAEDVRQHVLMSLASRLRGFEYDPARGRFRDYLGRIVRNVIFDLRARPNRVARTEGIDEDAVPAPDDGSIDDVWEREWLDHHYRRALRTVSETFEPRSIAVFERIVAGETVAAVAKAYGLSEQAVHKIKQRIRDRLTELVALQVRAEDRPDEPVADDRI